MHRRPCRVSRSFVPLCSLCVGLFLAGGCFSTRSVRSAEPKLSPLPVPTETTQVELKPTASADELRRALEEMDRPRGCWAYTLTRVVQRTGKPAMTYVATFHPGKPEKEMWTLVSINGRGPTDGERSQFLRSVTRPSKHKSPWQSALERVTAANKRSEVEARTEGDAVWYTLNAQRTDPAYIVTCRVGGEPRSLGAIRTVSNQAISIWSPVGRIHVAYSDSHVEFAKEDPGLPPFVRSRQLRLRMNFNGLDSGDISVDDSFSDYRKVTCYDDRFQVIVHEPSPLDFAQP
jgi:hypothetical protein